METNIMEQGKVDTTIENGIAAITFSHPKSNSLPGSLLRKLADEITSVGNDPEAMVIVLRSVGEKAFCAGASFDELLAIDNIEKGKAFFMGFAKVINAARKCKKFIIARVQAKAVGGGVGLVAACDHALAVDTASVKLSELALGIGPFVVGPVVERKIGTAAFSQLAINAAGWQTAQWAKEKGLYADIFPGVGKLDEAVNTLTEKLASNSPEAMEKLKNIFWKGTEHWDTLLEERAEISGRLVLSDFVAKAIEKFKK